MMAFAEKKLLKIGCPKIDLMVRKTNNEVIRFYEKLGYNEEEVIIMSRRLIEDEPFSE